MSLDVGGGNRSSRGWSTWGVYQGEDTRDNLQRFFRRGKGGRDLRRLASHVAVDGAMVPLEVFLTGDLMGLTAMQGCDGIASKQEHLVKCPCCLATPVEIAGPQTPMQFPLALVRPEGRSALPIPADHVIPAVSGRNRAVWPFFFVFFEHLPMDYPLHGVSNLALHILRVVIVKMAGQVLVE